MNIHGGGTIKLIQQCVVVFDNMNCHYTWQTRKPVVHYNDMAET